MWKYCVQTSFSKLRLLTEAEEECVHTHVIHAEETVCYEVATQHHRLQEQRKKINQQQIPETWKQGQLSKHTD